MKNNDSLDFSTYYDKAPLIHYASPYYDPVKAHEYYMKNRELKGRRSSAALTDKGKEIWNYTKKQIGEEKKAKVTASNEKQKKENESNREKAQSTRNAISQSLKRLNETLTEKAKKERESISTKQKASSEKRQEEIKKIRAEKIPNGISKAARARIVADKNERIAALQEEGKAEKLAGATKRQKINESAKAERAENSQSAKVIRQRVSENLKSVISATREAYKKAKTQLDANYEQIYQQEYNRIAAEHSKKSKRG